MTSIVPYARRLKQELQVAFAAIELIDADSVETLCRSVGHRWRRCFWTPTVVVLTFLRQILDCNCSCRKAVALTRAVTLGLAGRDHDVSQDPSAYSQARQRLPRAVLQALNARTVEGVEKHASATRLWCGRRVVIVDGLSVSTSDTPGLQKAYPQPCGQRPGCGFPVLRLAALFCWASGCLLDWAADSLHVSELTLFRQLLDRLAPGTVVLGDTFYSSYYDLALLRGRELHSVARLHQRRPTDLRFGTRLGSGDHLVTWTKPRLCPHNVSPADWASIPETLTVRHVQVEITVPGFRTQQLNLVTTLLDPVTCPADALAALYRDRWLAELNIRSLKTTLKMEVLKGQSKDMVLKELLVYQLAYNLIRLLMWRAAQTSGMDVRRLSVAGTQQRITVFLPHLMKASSLIEYRRLATVLLEDIAADVLPNRPNRIEPRAVKRRPKNYRRLTVPRAEARQMTYFIDG